MRKSTLSVFVLILSILAPWAAVAEARPSSPYLLVGTVKLDRHREVNKQEKRHPGANYTYGDCVRQARNRVSCKYFEFRTRDGVKEKVTHLVSERTEYKGTGRIRYTSFTASDPVEA